MGKVARHQISDEVVQWAESLSGMMTKIETVYGGVAAMLESSKWDESKTPYAMGLIAAISGHIQKIEREMHEHINDRPQ
jgi:hypothetical protein